MRAFSNIAVKIARIADRQFGRVTRRQLLDLGVPSSTIAHWVANHRLVTVHAGVYAVGHRQCTAIALAMAAVLACGDGAVLNHDSAGAVWGVRIWPARPEVTTPHCRRRKGIRTHRTQTLTHRDIRRHRRIRVTSPSRTILDIQSRLTDSQLVRAVNDLRIHEHLRDTELERLLARSHRLKNLIDPDENPSRSDLEDRFTVFCREYALPRPIRNAKPFGYEGFDALFPDEKVIVETDGWKFHRGRASFESDRERDAVAAEHGFLTIRVTDTRLDNTPAREAARLHRILEQRRGPKREDAA